MPSKTRIEYLDLAKGLCILLVVFFHATTYFHTQTPIAYINRATRLPLFFFLSGCFFKPYNGWLDFIKRRTNQLLIPFVFWFIVTNIFLVYLYSLLGIHIIYTQPVGIWHEVVRFLRTDYFFNIPIWFLLCLFEINIIFYILYVFVHKVFKRNQSLVICLMSILLGIVGLLLRYYHIDSHFFVESALDEFPFFAFGYLCIHHTKILKPNPADKYIPVILVVLFLFLYFFAPQESITSSPTPAIRNYLFFHASGLAGTLFVILLSKWIKHIPIVHWWGRYTIIILITHLVFMKHFVYIIRHFHLFPDHSWAGILIIFTLSMLCSSAAIPICKRFFPHVTAQKDLIPIRSPKDNTSQECPQNQE